MSRDAMAPLAPLSNAVPNIYTYIGYKPATFYAVPAAQILHFLTGQNAIFLSDIECLYIFKTATATSRAHDIFNAQKLQQMRHKSYR